MVACIGLILPFATYAQTCPSSISSPSGACTLSTNSVDITSSGSIVSSSIPIGIATNSTGLNLGGITIDNGGLLQYTGAVGTSAAISMVYNPVGAPSSLNYLGDININGTLTSSQRGVYINGFVANSIGVGANGLLHGAGFGVFLTDSSGVTGDIVNNGSITSGSYSIAVGGASAGVVASYVGGNIINNSTITSSNGVTVSIDGVVSGAITNSTTGTLNGAVQVGAGTVTGGIDNAGTINNTGNASGYAINISGNVPGGITNESTGIINGTVYANSSNSLTLNNSGQINGPVTFNATPATINLNGTSGVITGTVTGSGTTVNTVGSFSTANTFNVQSFNVNTGGNLTLNNDVGLVSGNTFTNAGNVTVTATHAPTITGNYSQSGTYTLGVNSPSAYSILNVSGNASFSSGYGFALLSSSTLVANNLYQGILRSSTISGFTTQTYTQTLGGTSYTYSILQDTTNSGWLDLCFGNCSVSPIPAGPSVADTQQSLVNTAAALQNTYTLQNSVLANSFYYDCNLFDVNNICVSAGGRNTAIQAANGLNNTSALLIASYRLDENNSRIGAYADQNLSVNNGGSTVNLGNNTPLIGLFAAWSQRPDGTGAEVKAGIAYGQKNTTITRQVVGTSEPGSGSSQLNSQGAQLIAKYGFGVMENVIVSPYIGMRYTQNNMGGYSEAASPSVTSPLTYSALNTNATTSLAGIGASYHFIPEATLFASTGVETDTKTANGTYSATGVSGLTPINFNVNPVKTRPTAMLGAYYDIEKNQRLGITGIYRQEAFQAVSTTTVMATYTVGF